MSLLGQLQVSVAKQDNAMESLAKTAEQQVVLQQLCVDQHSLSNKKLDEVAKLLGEYREFSKCTAEDLRGEVRALKLDVNMYLKQRIDK